ncbi:MAG TPA: class I SAM-dependent methyltransferase [Thermomicrobiales bacterium]|nr:class I SAM-dependent methyltransferase [Thermomicrobiales bacterium]
MILQRPAGDQRAGLPLDRDREGVYSRVGVTGGKQEGGRVSGELTAGRVLSEQQRYYNERAAEYDQWWLRIGRYDRGEAENAVWFAEQEQVRVAFDTLDWHGDIVELAGGTGIWTEWLALRARSLTVLDGSREMISINAARLSAHGLSQKATHHKLDLFEWEPERTWDGLFIGYFMSHVPAASYEPMLAAIAAAIRPGGVFGMLDGRREERSSSADQPPPGPESEIMTRRLNDGREFTIVKRYDEPDDLRAALARHGITADVRVTATHFIYATGRKE